MRKFLIILAVVLFILGVLIYAIRIGKHEPSKDVKSLRSEGITSSVRESIALNSFLQGVSSRGVIFKDDITQALNIMDDMVAHGGNYIRTDVGTPNIGVGPRYEKYVWQRTGPGNALDGYPKFDFEELDDSYFDEIVIPFLQKANDLGVVVELTLFDTNGWEYDDNGWDHCYWNPLNNINLNNIVPDDLGSASNLTADGGNLLRLQKKYIDKVIEKTSQFNNIIYELYNEKPGLSGRLIAAEWIREMVNHIKSKGDFLVSIDRNNRVKREYTKLPAETDPLADFVVVHSGKTFDIDILDEEYHNMLNLGSNKPVFMNEDYTYEVVSGEVLQNTPKIIRAVRMKKWLAFIAGAHHNYYTFFWNNDTDRPDEMLNVLKILTDFINDNNLHPQKMEPLNNTYDFIISHPGKFAYVLYNQDEEYVIYLMGDKVGDLRVNLPSGNSYRAWSYNPSDGQYNVLQINEQLISGVPSFSEDLVIYISKARSTVYVPDNGIIRPF